MGLVNKRKKNDGTVREPHKCGGSSLASRHDTIELQYSYSGKHSPLLHWKVFGGQLK